MYPVSIIDFPGKVWPSRRLARSFLEIKFTLLNSFWSISVSKTCFIDTMMVRNLLNSFYQKNNILVNNEAPVHWNQTFIKSWLLESLLEINHSISVQIPVNVISSINAFAKIISSEFPSAPNLKNIISLTPSNAVSPVHGCCIY